MPSDKKCATTPQIEIFAQPYLEFSPSGANTKASNLDYKNLQLFWGFGNLFNQQLSYSDIYSFIIIGTQGEIGRLFQHHAVMLHLNFDNR
jgi:hypothetical protein